MISDKIGPHHLERKANPLRSHSPRRIRCSQPRERARCNTHAGSADGAGFIEIEVIDEDLGRSRLAACSAPASSGWWPRLPREGWRSLRPEVSRFARNSGIGNS